MYLQHGHSHHPLPFPPVKTKQNLLLTATKEPHELVLDVENVMTHHITVLTSMPSIPGTPAGPGGPGDPSLL